MLLPPLTRRAYRGLIALAIVLPLFSLASLAVAAAWLNAHGGLAAHLVSLTRGTVLLSRGLESLAAGVVPLRFFPPRSVHASVCDFTWVRDDGVGKGEDDFAFALIEPDAGSTFSLGGHGHDSERLARLKLGAKIPTLWFRHGDLEYIVTDRASVDRARKVCEPLKRIGHDLGHVGGEMGAIGGELGEYGGRLGALGGRLGGLSVRLAMDPLSSMERDQLEKERDRIRAEMDHVRAEMESREHSSLRSRQADLRRRMEALKEQHRRELDEARAELRKLFEEIRATHKGERIERGERSI